LAARLISLGHDADTVPQEQLAGKDDATVWNAAQAAGRFLITQDLDFSSIHKFVPGTHHGLLLLRMREPGRQALINRVMEIFTSEDVVAWQRCVVVASERKIRIRRPE
jgi:predicted nuclease of predicted toxin-antitoxin system